MEKVSEEYILSTAMRRWGLSPRRKGRRWNSPCPVCGGTDRFIIFPNGGYWCSHGDCKGWLDDDKKDFKPDPVLMQKWKEDLEEERREQEQHDLDWRKGFKVGYVKGWSDAMTQVNRHWWHSQGINDFMISKYRLGFIPNKKVETEYGIIELPAYTIPVLDPDTEEIANIQYRLVDPPMGIGKYRQESGISSREFYAESRALEEDKAIVLEGAKKAIITYDRLDGEIQVIGLPGCSPSEFILERLKRYGKIWLALDPGCDRQAQRIKDFLPQTKVVKLPGKPDDLFLSGMTMDDFRNYCRLAR